jgi:hypothetical protein
MNHLKEETYKKVDGTSFCNTTIKATVSQLIEILGQPNFADNDGEDKVNFEWERENSRGNVFTVYDWKNYRPIGKDENIEWHIGGFNNSDTEQAKEDINAALKAIA